MECVLDACLQNYLREQKQTKYNLVCETLQFLDCICGSTTGGLGLLDLYINEGNVDLIIQALVTLTEYCQGPCHENQVCAWFKIILVWSLYFCHHNQLLYLTGFFVDLVEKEVVQFCYLLCSLYRQNWYHQDLVRSLSKMNNIWIINCHTAKSCCNAIIWVQKFLPKYGIIAGLQNLPFQAGQFKTDKKQQWLVYNYTHCIIPVYFKTKDSNFTHFIH